jgi:Fingers domain of DNA polymerase lambda
VWGCGDIVAERWYVEGCRTLDDVRKRSDLTMQQQVKDVHQALQIARNHLNLPCVTVFVFVCRSGSSISTTCRNAFPVKRYVAVHVCVVSQAAHLCRRSSTVTDTDTLQNGSVLLQAAKFERVLRATTAEALKLHDPDAERLFAYLLGSYCRGKAATGGPTRNAKTRNVAWVFRGASTDTPSYSSR